MGELVEQLVHIKSLRSNILNKHKKHGGIVFVRYDNIFDAFFLMIVPPTVETIVHYMDENIGLLYEAKSKEVVGIQIEGFVKSFLPKHPDLVAAWEKRKVPKNFGETMTAMNEIKPTIQQIYKASESAIHQESAHLSKLFRENLETSNMAVV